MQAGFIFFSIVQSTFYKNTFVSFFFYHNFSKASQIAIPSLLSQTYKQALAWIELTKMTIA